MDCGHRCCIYIQHLTKGSVSYRDIPSTGPSKDTFPLCASASRLPPLQIPHPTPQAGPASVYPRPSLCSAARTQDTYVHTYATPMHVHTRETVRWRVAFMRTISHQVAGLKSNTKKAKERGGSMEGHSEKTNTGWASLKQHGRQLSTSLSRSSSCSSIA